MNYKKHCADLASFIESIVDATGPFKYLNDTPIVAEAYKVLSAYQSAIEQQGEV